MAALVYATIVGVPHTILFQRWDYPGPYEFKKVWRDTNNKGTVGGQAMEKDTPVFNFTATGVVLESVYANLLSLVGQIVTLETHNQSVINVLIKNCGKLKGYDPTSVATLDKVATTYLRRMVLLELTRKD